MRFWETVGDVAMSLARWRGEGARVARVLVSRGC